MEWFRNKKDEKSPEARKLDSALRETSLKLEENLKNFEPKSKRLYDLDGNMYYPDNGFNSFSIHVVNVKENREEEISSTRKYTGYVIKKIDYSMKPLEYDYDRYSGIVTENFNRIMNDVNELIDRYEGTDTDVVVTE